MHIDRTGGTEKEKRKAEKRRRRRRPSGQEQPFNCDIAVVLRQAASSYHRPSPHCPWRTRGCAYLHMYIQTSLRQPNPFPKTRPFKRVSWTNKNYEKKDRLEPIGTDRLSPIRFMARDHSQLAYGAHMCLHLPFSTSRTHICPRKRPKAIHTARWIFEPVRHLSLSTFTLPSFVHLTTSHLLHQRKNREKSFKVKCPM